MNARIMDPSVVHESIFGNPLLYTRFRMAIELLGRLVVANPRSLSTSALCEASGHSLRTVRSVLTTLHAAGLIRQEPAMRDSWLCATGVRPITLADVFRSVSESLPAPRKKAEAEKADESRSAAQQNVELLLMQATMSIDQIVLQHLQSFDLGKLKAASSANSFRAFRPAYMAEPA